MTMILNTKCTTIMSLIQVYDSLITKCCYKYSSYDAANSSTDLLVMSIIPFKTVKRENAQQAHKRRLGKENIHKGGNVKKLPQDAPVNKEEVVWKRENGKVQEFVKMFSHEEQSKPTRRRESNALKLKKNLSQQTKLEEKSSKKSVEHNDVKVCCLQHFLLFI